MLENVIYLWDQSKILSNRQIKNVENSWKEIEKKKKKKKKNLK